MENTQRRERIFQSAEKDWTGPSQDVRTVIFDIDSYPHRVRVIVAIVVVSSILCSYSASLVSGKPSINTQFFIRGK